MLKDEMAKSDSVILQQFDLKEFLPVVVQFKEKFIISSPPRFPNLDLGIGFGKE